jgi:predicted nucleic acid-binding Zn ribbon protein
MAEREERKMQYESSYRVTCLNCANIFGLVEAFSDEPGWYTICPKCTSSFDVVLPNDSDILQSLLDISEPQKSYTPQMVVMRFTSDATRI